MVKTIVFTRESYDCLLRVAHRDDRWLAWLWQRSSRRLIHLGYFEDEQSAKRAVAAECSRICGLRAVEGDAGGGDPATSWAEGRELVRRSRSRARSEER